MTERTKIDHKLTQSVLSRLSEDRTDIGMQNPMIHMNHGKARSAT